MAKKEKEARKRALRRERAKERLSAPAATAEPGAGDETVGAAEPAVPQPEVQPAREKKQRPAEEERETRSFKEQAAEFFAPMTDFFREVGIEAKKINWPTREESWRSTMVVVVTIIFLAGFMGLFSFVFSRVAEQVFRPTILSTPPPVSAADTSQPAQSGSGSTPAPSSSSGGQGGENQPSGE